MAVAASIFASSAHAQAPNSPKGAAPGYVYPGQHYGGGGGYGRYGYGGYGYGGFGGGTTAAGSYATGMSNVIRAQGQYNVMTSEAMINAEQARQIYIENRQRATQAYFQMRQMNQSYRDAERGPPATPEMLARIAKSGVPKPLSPAQLDPVSGLIAWPATFQSDAFAAYRAQLDRLFELRAQDKAHVGQVTYTEVKQLTNGMQAKLDQLLRDKAVTDPDYVAGRAFLDSLAQMAHAPTL